MRQGESFGKIAIIGVGLIGGSLGMALRKRGAAKEVAGVFRRRSSLSKALERKAVDWGTLSVKKGVRGAEVVVVAVPVGLIAAKALEAAKEMEKGAVLTDVGSVKGEIIRMVEEGLPAGVSFVGAHPIAGSEKQGVAGASAELFEGSLCVITPGKKSTEEAANQVEKMWRAAGCNVERLSAEAHDSLLGEVSHLPHVVASALARSVGLKALGYGAGGFGDSTRIAGADPELWADILMANRRKLVEALEGFETSIEEFRRALADGSREEVVRLLREGKARREVFEARRESLLKGSG